jgi:hypothetical protein
MSNLGEKAKIELPAEHASAGRDPLEKTRQSEAGTASEAVGVTVNEGAIEAFKQSVSPSISTIPTEPPVYNRQSSQLILGWRLARDLGIEWFDHGKNHSHGNQPPNMLESVPAESVAMHTAIIAKSGSGKSFFLGRYLEEVLLKTGATVTIFDPNADFRKFKYVDPEVWKPHDNNNKVTDPNWMPCAKKRPPLPHEREMNEFSDPWKKINIRIFGNSLDPSVVSDVEQTKFDWKSLSPNLLLVGETGVEPSEFAAIHKYYVAGEALWSTYCTGMNEKERAALKKWTIEQYLTKAVSGGDVDNTADHLVDDIKKECTRAAHEHFALEPTRVMEATEKFIRRFKNAAEVSEKTKNEYKRIYRMIDQRGRIAPSGEADPFRLVDKSIRARVFDMPSFTDREDREFSILVMLDAIWESARDEWERSTNDKGTNEGRRPHLIVIDEAHNLIPSEAPASALRAEIRERIKTIAGEGRKYGLFLVIVTQRPDKVDVQVLSECGNQAIMLVPSLSVIEGCRDLLGLSITPDDALMIMKKFDKGYVWLSGHWSPLGPTVTFAAARRTKAGGADLPRGWMSPRKEVADAMVTVDTIINKL